MMALCKPVQAPLQCTVQGISIPHNSLRLQMCRSALHEIPFQNYIRWMRFTVRKAEAGHEFFPILLTHSSWTSKLTHLGAPSLYLRKPAAEAGSQGASVWTRPEEHGLDRCCSSAVTPVAR